MAEAHYVTREEVRVELGLDPDDDVRLPDAEADRLIRTAEILVEAALGRRPRQPVGSPQEGRSIAEADVDAYQWTALRSAVTALAARLKRSPDLLGPRFESASGPDFSYSKPTGPTFGSEVVALLRASDLVPTGARARP